MTKIDDEEHHDDLFQERETSMDMTAEIHEQTAQMPSLPNTENEEDIEAKIGIPRPSRFGGNKKSSSSSASIFRHRSTPSEGATFLEEDAINPFELDLHCQSFASAADEKERDYYKPLPVADQMGRFARLPSAYGEIEDDLILLGDLEDDVLQLDDDVDVEAQENIDLVDVQEEKTGTERITSVTTTNEQTSEIENNEENNNEQLNSNDAPVEKAKTKSRSVLTAGLESFKYLYSITLLIFCVVVVTGTIFTRQTTSTSNGVPPIVAFFIFLFLVVWLATMEGGQGALVGLKPVDRERYKETHPVAYTIKGVTNDTNLDRFIVGRQFLVVLVVFVSQLLSSSIPNVQLWGLGDSAKAILLDSGLALMVVTIVLGQLLAQLNAANCMLDFVNNYFMLYFVTYPSLLVEFSGLLHSVYLVQMLFSKIGGVEETERKKKSPMNALQSIFFWARVLFSLAVLGFAFAVTLSALFQGQTTVWKSVPTAVSIVLFFVLMCFVGMMEGMQIAFFAVMNFPREEFENYGVAQKNCDLAFRGENLQSFLIGRQICVTICTFLIARITTLNIEVGTGMNIFGVSDGLQAFFNTGLLGAVITTIISSLAWRIVASSFPLAFLSNPLVNVITRLCLLFEASGVCSSAWVLSMYNKKIAGYHPDDIYLRNEDSQPSTPASTRDKDIERFVTVIRFSYSLGLFLFSVVLIVACIFTRQTSTTIGKEGWTYSVLVLIAFWFLIGWLALIEGGLGCLLGLKSLEASKYESSHPHSFKNTAIVHKGDNMQRFIVGRQFLVVAIVFLCTWMLEPVLDVSVLGLPDAVNKIFLSSDLALIVILVIAGQLTAEVNAASCMLDFINSRFVLYFVTYLSLAVEWSGLLHSVYLVQIFFSKISGQKVTSNEPERSLPQQIFFWARVIASFLILGFAFAVTFLALLSGQATLWKSLPDAASVAIILLLMSLVGMMEGVQIALFGVINLSDESLESHRMAHANYKLALSGQNLQAFLIGRQICVTCFFVLIARLSTLNIVVGEDENLFGVSDDVQRFFNAGVLGALLTTIVASLVWRLFASSFPLTFMSNPIIYVIIGLCLLVEASGICSACYVFGRWTKLLFGYQSDPVYLENQPREGSKPVTRRDKDIDVTSTVIRYIFSTALLCFGIVITASLIFTRQTDLSSKTHPVVVFLLVCFLLLYLATMEGGQGCLVGLQGIDKDLYSDSHRTALKNTRIAHKGNNMQRFIVGRQFLVVLVVFIINLCASPLPGSAILKLPDTVASIFVDSGVSLILVTVIVGQLTAQVNAASCMLDFINNCFMLYFVTYVSMAIEMSGLLHCVYLVQIIFAKITGTDTQSSEPPRTFLQTLFFWGRALFSLAVLAFAFAVTLDALFDGKTTSWDGVPGSVSVIIFFVLMCIAGLMEGMQIALFAVVNLPENELAQHKMAKSICRLAFSGNNLQAFLIGRQIFVTLCTFVIARLTTLDVEVGVDNNIFGVSDGLQAFFNTGLLGAIITTVVGSLAWRIIAASFPVAFLSNPLVYLILRLCLVLEASGICSAAWLLALIHKQMIGYQTDDVYIGKARNAKKDDIVEEQLESCSLSAASQEYHV